MAGFTSSSNKTRSPITMASTPGFSPGVNPAHEVNPMNGGTLLQPSMVTGTSLRGKDTLTTLSVVSGFPPVAEATVAGSMGFASTFGPVCAAPLALFGGGAACAVEEQPPAVPP